MHTTNTDAMLSIMIITGALAHKVLTDFEKIMELKAKISAVINTIVSIYTR